MRASSTACSWAMRARSVDSRAAISASCKAFCLAISRDCVSRSFSILASRTALSWRMRAFSTSSRAAISSESMAFCRAISRARTSRSEAMRASAMARSLAMRAFSMVSRAVIWASSASVSRVARSFANSARCCALRNSISRSCSSRADSLSRSISSACFSASRFRARIWIIASCSISLRSLRRSSISRISAVKPSASNRFDGLKNSRLVWSISRIATLSSSSPFFSRSTCAADFTRAT